MSVCVTPFHCRPKPYICHLKPVTCRPAQVSSRHGPVTNCRPEPPCVVTDIPKRDIGTASIKLWFKFKYGFCQANENQDALRLSVSFCVHSTIVIYYLIASKFHIWITFIKLLSKFEYGLCRITNMATDMATNMAATCPFALDDTLT